MSDDLKYKPACELLPGDLVYVLGDRPFMPNDQWSLVISVKKGDGGDSAWYDVTFLKRKSVYHKKLRYWDTVRILWI